MKKLFLILTSGLLLWGLAGTAFAQVSSPAKTQYASESKSARARFEADKKLCNDEASSGVRLQCRRDAKAGYDQALSAARAQLASATTMPGQEPASRVACPDCGKVTAVRMTEKDGEGGALGIIAGGATGAVLGHQVGGGRGKDLATIAGAVGGAYAGKKIEEKMKTRKVWTVSVRHADGRKGSFNFDQNPGLKVGDPVRKSGNSIVRD